MLNKLKKIMLVVASIGCIMSMSSCNKQPKPKENVNKYFDLIEICSKNHESICYDKNTGVMYYRWHEVHQYGITPIYNADGTLKIYERTNNETTNK